MKDLNDEALISVSMLEFAV